jgi:hypothetical protein
VHQQNGGSMLDNVERIVEKYKKGIAAPGSMQVESGKV